MTSFASILLATALAAAAPALPQAQCDMPGNDLRSLPQKDAEACRDACKADSACKAYVFISGWNRCLFKTKEGRRHAVRFYAGHIEKDPTGARTITDAQFDRDYSGKDMRKLPHTKSGEACGEACLGDKACEAFVYIGGYADCWLKSTRGKPTGKIFSCGSRS